MGTMKQRPTYLVQARRAGKATLTAEDAARAGERTCDAIRAVADATSEPYTADHSTMRMIAASWNRYAIELRAGDRAQ